MSAKVACVATQVLPFVNRLADGEDVSKDPCFLAIEREALLGDPELRVKLCELVETFLRFLRVEYHTPGSGERLWAQLAPIEESLGLRSKLLLIYQPIVRHYREPAQKVELQQTIERFKRQRPTRSTRTTRSRHDHREQQALCET